MSIPFEPGAIRMLAKLMTETGLTEIELAEKDRRLRVVRGHAQMPMQQVLVPTAAAQPVSETAAPAIAAAADPNAVLSPMVGVAYLSPEPGAPPYVQVGSRVAQGQTVLLIEAMKTFNQIKAPRSGTVTRLLIENGAPVEYGEPLMVIE